jgi:uncharacterized protein YbdZ (MbtH family)
MSPQGVDKSCPLSTRELMKITARMRHVRSYIKQGEITMTTQDENQEITHSSAYNPFPEPQTIPSGWDLSGLLSAPKPFDLAHKVPVPFREVKPALVIEVDDFGEITMNTKDESYEIVHSSAYNPFPEPQTIPLGWDTSGFFSAPDPASSMDEEETAES